MQAKSYQAGTGLNRVQGLAGDEAFQGVIHPAMQCITPTLVPSPPSHKLLKLSIASIPGAVALLWDVCGSGGSLATSSSILPSLGPYPPTDALIEWICGCVDSRCDAG